MTSTIERIRQVGALTEEAEHLFEGGPKPDAKAKRIVKAFVDAGFTKRKDRMGMKAGGGSYTNPQGDVFSKTVPTGPGQGPKAIHKTEQQVLAVAASVGLTEKHSLGDQVGLSEPGSHPIVWYHWTKGGTFYVDVDYTSDY